MAFNPIQYGDLSTRLRRALGLRGDLGFNLAGPSVMPVARVLDVTGAPYADLPEHWAVAALLPAVSGNYGAFIVNGLAGSRVVVDRWTSSVITVAQLYRNTAQPAIVGQLLKEATTLNAPSSNTGSNATVSPITALTGTTATAQGSFCFVGDLYVDGYGPVVLGADDWLWISTTAPTTSCYFGAWGRRVPIQQ